MNICSNLSFLCAKLLKLMFLSHFNVNRKEECMIAKVAELLEKGVF